MSLVANGNRTIQSPPNGFVDSFNTAGHSMKARELTPSNKTSANRTYETRDVNPLLSPQSSKQDPPSPDIEDFILVASDEVRGGPQFRYSPLVRDIHMRNAEAEQPSIPMKPLYNNNQQDLHQGHHATRSRTNESGFSNISFGKAHAKLR